MISNGQSLSLPGTVPVPKDYAQKYDKGDAVDLRQAPGLHRPVHDQQRRQGQHHRLQGRPPDRARAQPELGCRRPTTARPTSTRSRSSAATTSTSPAAASSAARSLVSGDFAAPPVNVLRSALSTRTDQLAIVPSQGIRFIALNTTVKPFDDVNVRRAAAAVDRPQRAAPDARRPDARPDRDALHRAGRARLRGGGRRGRHVRLHEEPGRRPEARAGVHEEGRLRRAASYSGPPLLMVGDNQPPASTHRRGRPEPAREARLQVRLPPGVAADDVLEVLRLAEGEASRSARTAAGARTSSTPSRCWTRSSTARTSCRWATSNWSQVDDPELDARPRDRGQRDRPAEARDGATARSTARSPRRAYVIPWLWDNQINIASEDVKGVLNGSTVVGHVVHVAEVSVTSEQSQDASRPRRGPGVAGHDALHRRAGCCGSSCCCSSSAC